VTLPVVPQAPGVILEHRHADLGLVEQFLGGGRVEARRVVDELQHRPRHLQVAQHLVEDVLQRPAALDRLRHRLRHHVEDLRVDAEGHLRCVRGAREDIEHLAHASRLRVGQVEALAVLLRQVRQVHERVDDEVDRHRVDVTALDADERHPARPGLAQLLQRLEEVVGAVDLVDHARLRMAQHDAGTVDAERHLAVGADQRLGVVLGAVVRVVEFLGLLEHVLAERAAIEAGRGDRTDVVEATGADGRRHGERAFGADDVRAPHFVGGRVDVVDRAEVIEVLDLALEPREVGLGDAELRLAEVTLDRYDATHAVLAPELAELVELADGARPHEHVDRALAALQERLHQEAPDEPRRPGHEIGHGSLPRSLRVTLGAVGTRVNVELTPSQVPCTAGTRGVTGLEDLHGEQAAAFCRRPR
jgi:hypothetical protein